MNGCKFQQSKILCQVDSKYETHQYSFKEKIGIFINYCFSPHKKGIDLRWVSIEKGQILTKHRGWLANDKEVV